MCINKYSYFVVDMQISTDLNVLPQSTKDAITGEEAKAGHGLLVMPTRRAETGRDPFATPAPTDARASEVTQSPMHH